MRTVSPAVGLRLVPIVALVLAVIASPADAFQLRRVAFAGAAVTVADTTTTLRATLGQAVTVAGVTADTSRVLHQGFWYPHAGAVVHVEAGGAPRALPALAAPVPNPFPHGTAIAFSLSANERVRLEIFDASGRRVRTLVHRDVSAGPYRVFWDGADDAGRGVGNGVYLLRLEIGEWITTRKLVKLR